MMNNTIPQKPSGGWRLVVSDLDGTLLNEYGLISDENLAAVAALAEQGIAFTVATGRMEKMARAFIRQLQVRLPVITCNGAVIIDPISLDVLYKATLAAEDVRSLVAWLADRELDYLCYTLDQVYYPTGSRRIERFHQYNAIARETGHDPVQLCEISTDGREIINNEFIKVLAILPGPEDHQAMQDYLNAHPAFSGMLSWSDAMDIAAAGVNKGDGLRRLAEHLKISTSQIAAFGDNDNDVPLLTTAGLGIAMGNATAAALNASQVITANHEESGVALGIREFILTMKF